MDSLVQAVKANREAILIGEIGALLHDIGKCHPDFIKKNSVENIGRFNHAEIDSFLSSRLTKQVQDEKFKIEVSRKKVGIYSIMKDHHSAGTELIEVFKKCDHLDSADDKGIVRKKQCVNNTLISSPFGNIREKIDLENLQSRFCELSDDLISLFERYISGSTSLTCFRRGLIDSLEKTFIHALGETRIPSNDVTLWDHSNSTASLFKSLLCSIALGGDPGPQRQPWRILGFCWDGTGFIEKGRKIADILKRNEVVAKIKDELKKVFEDEIPIGNAIYEDISGIYFTFPELRPNESTQLAEECAEIGLEVIRRESDNEIWPFFTLSRATRTLTIIANELKLASEKLRIPKMTPTLFVWYEGTLEEKTLGSNPELPILGEGEDVCPVCQLRSKYVNSDRCDVCDERREGRMKNWFLKREDTIWIDEIADEDNRIALFTLSFDLDKWLDGTMIATIYSQSFLEWENSDRAKKFFNNSQNIHKLKNKGVDMNADPIQRSRDILKIITDEKVSIDPGFKSDLINTFFEDIESKQRQDDENYIEKFVNNLKFRLDPQPFNASNLQKSIFTQNPSPGRLYRMWKETEEFFEAIIREIRDKIYSTKWKRIRFSVNSPNLKLKNDTPCLIQIKGMEPESLLVFHSSEGEFYTIESLEKFKFNDKSGIEAVKYCLIDKAFNHLAYEDEPDRDLLHRGQMLEVINLQTEEYYPFIEIAKMPRSLRFILPAQDSVRILKLVTKLYKEKFKKVIGKLPLNVGLLVSKRKFPLYLLLDASEKMLDNDKFRNPEEMNPWWDITEIRKDTHYGFYLDKRIDAGEGDYTLEDQSVISQEKRYVLYPGYFDFDLLLATTDRYRINYDENGKRIDEDYRLLSSRAYYLHQISQMINLWEVLTNNLSNSQINFIEEALTRKLVEWKAVNDPDKETVFKEFAVATLKDAFLEKWAKLEVGTQDIVINSLYNNLVDTIVLFKHTIKVKEEGG